MGKRLLTDHRNAMHMQTFEDKMEHCLSEMKMKPVHDRML